MTNEKFNIIIILFITLSTVFVLKVKAQQLPVNPLDVDDIEIGISSIIRKDTSKPIFTFYNRAFDVCLDSGICGPGNYKDFVPIRTLIIYKGDRGSRSDKSKIIWEVKFLEYAPSKITYSETPYNGRQIVKPSELLPGNEYTICIYPQKSIMNCSKWIYESIESLNNK
ncbi:MAG: hypothetical protein AB1782_01295 [Cyanobacteriota bacterium]